MTTTVLIVDDHPVVRSGLRTVLDADPSLAIIGEAGTGEEALEMARQHHPDVVLCDLRLGDGMDGIETTEALRRLTPAPAVVILTTFDRDVEIMGAMEAGASGYILKDVPPEKIADAIRRAGAGELVLSPGLASRVLSGMRSPRLTEREIEVLQLLSTGATNKEISRTLFVTEATVKSHIAHIFTKLDVDSRSRAVHVARTKGFL